MAAEAMVAVTIRLTAEEYRKLQELAGREGKTMTEVVRGWVRGKK